MVEAWRRRATEQPCEAQLARSGREEVFAANHEVHALIEVVHDDGELIRPVTEAVAHQQVAALRGGRLMHGTEALVDECFLAVVHADATGGRRVGRKRARPAASGVSRFLAEAAGVVRLEIAAGTIARIGESGRAQLLQRGCVALAALALPRCDRIGHESEPVEILDDRVGVFVAASRAIVIFEAEDDPAAAGAGDPPYVQCVHDVTEVQPARRRRREPGDGPHVRVATS